MYFPPLKIFVASGKKCDTVSKHLLMNSAIKLECNTALTGRALMSGNHSRLFFSVYADGYGAVQYVTGAGILCATKPGSGI